MLESKTKMPEEYQDDISNYLAARKWLRKRVRQGIATDADRNKVDVCRQLAVKAREAGAVAPDRM